MHGYAGSLFSKQKGGTSKGSQPKAAQPSAEGATDGSQVPPPSAGSFWSSPAAAQVVVAKNDSAAPSETSEPPPAGPDSTVHPAGRSDPIAAAAQPPQLGSTWSSYGAGLLRSGLSAASSTYEVASAKASATYEVASAKASATYAVASAKAPGLVEVGAGTGSSGLRRH